MGLLKKITGGTDKKLLSSGLPGRGVVLEVVPTGTTVQMGNGLVQRACRFKVEVTLDDHAPYEATCKQRVPEVTIPQFQPGSTVVAVRANPDNLEDIVLDFNSAPPTVTLQRDPSKLSAAELLATGRPAKAVIVESQPLGVKNPDGVDMHAFLLTVMPDGADPYQAKVGNPVPSRALPLIYPGSHVPVKLGDQDPNQVVIDWERALAGAN